LFAVVAVTPASAASRPSGRLDPSFGRGGKVLTDFSGSGSSDEAEDLAIQSDGKLVAAGSFCCGSGGADFALARYKLKPDGTLDKSFGSSGKVTTDFGGAYDAALAVAIQSGGKIVAVGVSDASGSSDFALARYNSDGTLDTGFGSAGKVTTDFSGSGSTDQATAVAIQSDGKIVAVGLSDVICCGTGNFALARYNSDGTLDTGFGSTGKVTTDFSGSDSNDWAYALAIQSDAKIVAGGFSNAGGNFEDFALARYTPDGTLDATFGSAGKVLTDF
jgi:uncharacterized delta-60 repeat protein